MTDLTSASIMVIDDQAENLDLLGRMLRTQGWSVRAFQRGDEALASARESAPDVVLLDIRMPVMDGLEVCRQFKADERLRHVPVIFLSGLTDSAEKVRAFEVGGADYVTKPFAMAEVLARTRLQFELKQYQLRLEELVRERTAELSEAHRRLRIWDDATRQWLDVLSHEMRTPLQGIFGVVELLFADVPPTEASTELMESYARSRARILKLIDDAFTITTIDVGAAGFAVTPVPLAGVLAAALRTLGERAARITSPASAEAIEGVTVLCEPKLLDRALSDLLLTATQCVHPHEAVLLDAGVIGQEARMTIATTGRPLSPEALSTFFAVGGQRALLKGGGDYGLAPVLANRIIQLFNGRTTVRNGDESGILIEVWLPAQV